MELNGVEFVYEKEKVEILLAKENGNDAIPSIPMQILFG
jgi:hypothetical protein